VPLVSADLPLTGHSDDCMDRGTFPLPCNCGADLPLAGDELATIKARAEAATPGPWEQAGRFLIEGRSAMLGEAVPVADVVYDRDVPHIAGMDPETTLRLVAEVERLRADNEAGRVNLAHYREIYNDLAGQNNRLHEALHEARVTIQASVGHYKPPPGYDDPA
jgi:hypothetical protein